MADNFAWYLHAVDLATDYIPQTQRQGFDPGQTFVDANDGGLVDVQWIGTGEATPTINCSTTAIAQLLTKTTMDGLSISASPVILYFSKGIAGGSRSSGAVSMKATVAKALVIPVSIRASTRPPATIDYRIIPIYDGTNLPVIWATTSLPTITETKEMYCAGPCKINGATIEGITDISIDFGFNLDIIHDSGHVYPRYAGIRNRKSRITIKTTDLTYATTLTMAGAAVSSTTIVYLRQCADGGGRTANATETHISFLIGKAVVVPGPSEASENGPGSQSFVIAPAKGLAAEQIVLDTTAAIA